MKEHAFDVIVIGAGAAGLMAAWELVQTGKKVAIVEAKDHVGGRAHTILDDRFDMPVELGAEFVHGNLELTLMLLKKANVNYYKLNGDIWQNEDGNLEEQKDFIEDYSALHKKFKEVKEDISVAHFIEQHLQDEKFEELRFTVKNYVEGYYAADTHKASTFSLREELTTADDEQYRIDGGYTTIMEFMHRQCEEKGVTFFLSEVVKEIHWQKNEIVVISSQQRFLGQKVLITVPVGVLQSEKISFYPTIPEEIKAAKQLGYGPVIKTILQFDEPFWQNRKFTQGKNMDNLSFIFSKSVIPTWWTYYPKDSAMITGWSGGPHAENIRHLNEKEILQKALQSLSGIFSIEINQLQKKIKAWHIVNWMDDPCSCGAYSYQVVDGDKAQASLTQPLENTLFFAGEGLYKGVEIGTVEAALVSGRDTAHQIAASFDEFKLIL